jgi:hypothetical protein
VTALEVDWGGAVRLDLDFRQRAEYVTTARRLISELCEAELGALESSNWVMATQELLENLAKYSNPGRASLAFELALRAGSPVARLVTSNPASPARLEQAAALLGRIIGAADPIALYDELLRESAEREGSRLGLIRIRAEAGFELGYAISGERLEIRVSAPVTPRGDAP